MSAMAKAAVILVLAVLLVAVAAAAVVTTPARDSSPHDPIDIIRRAARMEGTDEKSTLTDIVSSIGTQLAAATDQVFLVTGQVFNSAFGGFGNFFQSIQNFLSGKPIVATTTGEDGSGSVVFLVHSKPKE